MANSESERRDAARRHGPILIVLVSLACALTVISGFFFEENLYLNLLVPGVLIVCMWRYKSYCCDTLELSDEETGDSLYYLGFLFTAAALVAGILVISLKLQGQGGAVGGDVVVSFLPSFAVALVTTIFGLGWRVVLSRGVGENDASTDLVTAYSELTDRLLNTAADLEAAYAELKDQLLNVAADLTDQTKLTTDQFQILLTILKQKAQEVEQEFTGFTDSMSAALSESGAADYADALKESIETLNKAAESMSKSSRDADSRLESAGEALTAAAGQLSADAAAQAQTMQDASSALGVVKQKAQEAEQAVVVFKSSVETLHRAAGELRAGQVETVRSAEQLSESAEGLRKSSEALASSKSTASLLENAVNSLTAAVKQLDANSATQTQKMKDTLKQELEPLMPDKRPRAEPAPPSPRRFWPWRRSGPR